jgi:TonB family protein
MKSNFIFLFLFIAASAYAQDEQFETCTVTAEHAWNGDTTAVRRFISNCGGHIDTLNFDANNQTAIKQPHHETISFRLKNGIVLHTDSIFFVTDRMPEFPGKSEGLLKYITEQTHYPEQAREKKTEGRVFISFIIERDGNVSHAKVSRGIGNGCDEAALQVIRKMPKWTPGTSHGKPVRVQINLPVKFSAAG